MAGFGGRIGEIDGRSLGGILVTYVAASWIGLQVVEQLTEILGLPDWVRLFSLILLLLGFPVVVATALVRGLGRDSVAEAESPERAGPADRAPWERTPTEAGEAASPAEPAGMPEKTSAPARGGLHLLSWRNAVWAGLVAFALLGMVTAAYMITRSLGIGPAGTLVAKGVLEERSAIVLAEFESETGDTLLARAATEALRVDLAQSPVVRLVEPSSVGQALLRMRRAPDSRLNAELARELAVREGIPAIIGGKINAAGSGFVLSARLVSAAQGEILTSHRETASDSSRVIEAIDALSRKLRERIGESLKTIRADQPLEQVTTSSVEALRKYSLAIQAIDVEGDDSRGIALLEEAIALDSTFAMAHRKLGVALSNRFFQERTRVIASLTKAFENRDRLTERERYLAMASYYSTVENDLERALTSYQSLVAIEPHHHTALNNIGTIYSQLGDPERAGQYYGRAIEADSADAQSYSNLVISYMNQGDLAGARSTLQLMRARFPDNPSSELQSANLDAVEGDYEGAAARYRAVGERWRGSVFLRSTASGGAASIAALRGRLAEAQRHYEEVLALAEQSAQPVQYLNTAFTLAQVDLILLGDTAAAERRVEAAVRDFPLADIPPLDRPYLGLAAYYASVGQPARARTLVATSDSIAPALVRSVIDQVFREMTEGAIAVAEGRIEDAIRAYRRAGLSVCPLCPLPALAALYDATGQPDSALAVYERYIGQPMAFRTFLDQMYLATAYERLGALYEDRREWEKARLYYAKLTELWADADATLQPRVLAARERLEAILEERG